MSSESQALLLTTTTHELPVQATSGTETTGLILQQSDSLINATENINMLNTFSELNPTNHLNLAHYLPFVNGYSDLEIIGLGLVVLIWVLTIIRVLRDASARSNSRWYQVFSALLITVFTPIVWLPLYLAFRPLVYKWERGYWREAMTQGVIICPHCQNLTDENHNACVYCGENLKITCKECEHRYYRGYEYCPECGAPNL